MAVAIALPDLNLGHWSAQVNVNRKPELTVFTIKVAIMESVLYMTLARYMAYNSQSLPRKPGPLAVERPTNRCSDHDIPKNDGTHRERW